RLGELVAVHLSVQPDAAAGGDGAVRPCRQRPAGRAADRRPAARGCARHAGGARLRERSVVPATRCAAWVRDAAIAWQAMRLSAPSLPRRRQSRNDTQAFPGFPAGLTAIGNDTERGTL